MTGGETLIAVVSRELAFLIHDHGFRLISGDAVPVRLESAQVGVEVRSDPREGVEVEVFRLGHESLHERWHYNGMIGRAQVPRLLQIAGERMRSAPGVIEGDPDIYQRLTADQTADSAAWTRFYSGTGPRPRSGKLP